MHLFIYYFDSKYILTYLVIGIIFWTLQNSPIWLTKVSPVMEKLFFSTKFLHKSLKGGCAVNILNSEDISQIKSLNSLLESEGEEVIA